MNASGNVQVVSKVDAISACDLHRSQSQEHCKMDWRTDQSRQADEAEAAPAQAFFDG
jgi:hypothetical protein